MLSRQILIPLLVLLGAVATPAAEMVPDAATVVVCETLWDATLSGDIERFHSVCDDGMRDAITPAVLAGVTAQVQTSLAGKRHRVEYQGFVAKPAGLVSLWRVAIAGTEEDLLLTLTTQGGLCTGFFIK
ncbi:MAG: hypothetical protein PF961_19900 [Planctomycetota bacterium]|jgi:hypothetical protein|nr:hypothetical protein [Planctomycetota bacterium]